MSQSAIAERLSKAIEYAARSAKFCVAGSLPGADPGIEVEGIGAVRLPLKRAKAKELIAHCHAAPYGKGTKTLIDKNVRNTFELDPKCFRLSGEWNSAIARAAEAAAEQLGLPAGQLEARLYKLLVYERGGFFLPHRDSEKHDRMVASMIVLLPSPFEGGTLTVRHGNVKQKLAFDEARSGKAACYAAFYADCEHEVERVTSGVRLCLAYNLVLKPSPAKPAAAGKPAALTGMVADPIASWVAAQPMTPLVFALEHHYTERGLSLDLLKGEDRQLADLVVAAAEHSDCLVHLAQVSRHLLQFADDGSFERSYSRSFRPRRRELEIGETYEDELTGTQWADLDGKKQPWGEIPFDLSAIVSSTPIDAWKPTSEEYEGYTGNAGNSLDRWYHRSAIVLWHRDHHFDVVASAGTAVSIPLFCSMAAKLAKTPKKRLDDARGACIRFARAIAASWPHSYAGYGYRADEVQPTHEDFRGHLLLLHDRDTIALFLSKLAEHDQSLRLNSFLVDTCREFGWDAFGQELKQLLVPRPDVRREQEIPIRDVEWLAAFCLDKRADAKQSALAQELCALAAARFCEPRSRQRAYWEPSRREPSVSEKSLPLLLKALLAAGCDEEAARVIRFVQEVPDQFSLDDSQVPALKLLLPWSQQQFGSAPPHLTAWLASVRRQLESSAAKKPAPPSDWARPVEVKCTCQYCAQLRAFLADPANEVGRIPAREEMRQHLAGIISQHQCDVKSALERKGSPYSLVLTKTAGSYERALKRFEADCLLLSALPPVC